MTRVSTIIPQHMRTALGNFCSGITVVTAMDHDQPVGFTCQSFSSLSLDPPLVSFNPARTSTTWPKIRAGGVFAINVLSSDQVAISSAFAQRGADKFRGVKWEAGPLGAPLIHGVLAWAECKLWAEYDGGDHTIVAAEVLNLKASSTAGPLLFYQGEYHLLNPQRHW
jgi:3-hydroxy-9,10-secoandrosta-1,3,5(10)-triene-9,17-dione monooxygenase reductase component